MKTLSNHTEPALCLIRRLPEAVSRIDILMPILDLEPESELGAFCWTSTIR